MTVLMYQKRFVAPILDKIKRQTIRPDRKRPIKVGEALSHRHWEDVAYRSPQVEFLSNECLATFPIEVAHTYVKIASGYSNFIATTGGLNEFARGDGFEDWNDMVAYLTAKGGYGLPFRGVLIQWE